MIKLFGCSFTQWIYPTWADFVKLHYKCPVNIYGRPGMGNQSIKKMIMLHAKSGDHVIPMYSGNDRHEHGIDLEFSKNDIKRFIDNKFWTSGFAHEDKMFVIDENNYSLFHSLYTQAENIVDIQSYCKANKIKYNAVSWQSLYSNLKQRRTNYGRGKPTNLKRYLSNTVFNTVYNLVDKDAFLDKYPLGLLDYIHSNKKLFEYQNTWDFHPSCFAHYSYFVDYVKPVLDQQYVPYDNLTDLRNSSLGLSQYYASLSCHDAGAPNGDNDFVHEKFLDMRKMLVSMFFEEFEDNLVNGINFE